MSSTFSLHHSHCNDVLDDHDHDRDDDERRHRNKVYCVHSLALRVETFAFTRAHTSGVVEENDERTIYKEKDSFPFFHAELERQRVRDANCLLVFVVTVDDGDVTPTPDGDEKSSMPV